MDNEYQQITPKISGYLEKKGRKKMMSCYKKYWFVLEGRLLLYYKSKDEYDAISPCKGSINLGPTCNVKPCSSNSGVFQIESKTTTITLRAENREDQHKWMEALISALNQKNDFKKLNHFRYSVGELSPSSEKIALERQNTLPEKFVTTDSSNSNNNKIIEKLQRMGAKSYGIGVNIQKSAATLQRQISFSDESIPSSTSFKTESRFRNAESVIIENEEYGKLMDRMRLTNSVESVDDSSEGIYERIPSSDSVFLRRAVINQENNTNRSTLITDNDVYWNRSNIEKFDIDNTDYCCEVIDYNDNNIKQQIKKSSQKSDSDENVYAEANIGENRNTGNSAEYPDIDQVEYTDVDQYVEIDGLRNSSVSSQGSNEEKDKKIFGFGKKNKGSKEKPEEKKKKVQKSESFLQRVWHKKSKNKKNKKDIILMSASNVAEKINMTDDEAMKTLGELQDILQKQNAVVKQSHQTRRSATEEETIEEAKEICQEIRMDIESTDDTTPEENKGQNCPTLPPRNPKKSSSSSYKETVKPQPPLVPPKMRNRREHSTTLDDILNDLNKRTETAQKVSLDDPREEDCQKKEGKVKELIKRFSIGKEEGVEIRQRSPNRDTSTSDCNELDKLLDELAKVTTAPIMTPGVTTSLINPEISDTEIMNMVPIRRRRMSDPDYDVPRPHKSLINLPKKDENALEATRFFGPILKPSDYASHTSYRPPTPPADYHSNLPSITPDSLEVECRKNELSHEELRKMSFESHEYLSYNRTSHHNLNYFVDGNLYSDPRSLISQSRHNGFNILQRVNVRNNSEESESRFVDSLEP